MSNHPPPELSPADVVAAAHRGDSAAVERAAASDNPQLRRAAVGSFHRLGVLSTQRLVAFLDDEDRLVRHRAAEIAARRLAADEDLDGGATVVRALLDRLADDPLVAEVAAFALGESTGGRLGEGDPVVVSALESTARHHDEHLVREAAVAALGSLGAGRETILAALGDRATIRRRAVLALAPFEGPDVEAALQAALDDRDWQVRQAAEDLLADPDAEDDGASGTASGGSGTS